jgi:two-component system, response regulator PdtaR
MPKVILIVDDEPLLRALVRDVLEDIGHAVKEAGTADEAIKLLEEGGIAAVLTDIEMPGPFNGLDLAWMVRAMWPTIPVVVTSGRQLPKKEDLPPHTPMLTKPFSPDRLIDVIGSAAS